MKKPLTAVVLAGGAGTRFWPLTSNKLLVPFFGKPFVDFSVLDVLPPSVSRIVFIASKDNYQALSSMKTKIPAVTVLQERPGGMADALVSARHELAGSAILLLIADHLIPAALIDLVVQAAETKSAFGVIPGWKTAVPYPGGYLRVNGERLIGIVEKPEPGREPSDMVAVSGQYIEDANLLLDEIGKTASDRDDVYERALTNLMAHVPFTYVPYTGQTASLKYPWQVLETMDYLFASGFKPAMGKNVTVKSNVVIEGDVVIGDNVRIFENTKITGPCYIGADSIIGNNNIIRHSHIGSGCVTGFNTDITRSYIGDQCWFHSNYVGDSVLEANVSMGSGTVLANLRLDESEISSEIKGIRQGTKRNKLGACIGANVRLGVNVSVMPGVKIGGNSFVAAGLVIPRDIPSGSFVSGETKLTVTRNEKTADTGSRAMFRRNLP